MENVNLENVVVVLLDFGSVICVCNFVIKFDLLFVIVDKRRFKVNVVEIMNIIGDVKDKICLMVDDMIDMVGIIVVVVQVFMDYGVKEVYVCCMYLVLFGFVVERI